MNEPRRLRESSQSPLEQALLDAGAAYRSSPAARAKTLAGLGLAGSAAMSVAAVSAGSSLFAKLSWAKLVAAAAAVGAATALPISYYALHSRTDELRPKAALAVAAPATPLRVGTRNAAVSSEPVVEAAVVPGQVTASSSRVVRSDVRSSPTAASAALTAELGALDAARSTLARGDARGALSLLDAYFRAYPRGRLALEGEVMRIDALARSGQVELSRQHATAFLRRHPNSVLTTRVRGYLQR
jgi:hypothetical protein